MGSDENFYFIFHQYEIRILLDHGFGVVLKYSLTNFSLPESYFGKHMPTLLAHHKG